MSGPDAADVVPLAAVPLHALAALVGYSRVHSGVHYPGDVVAGALLGSVVSEITTGALDGRLRIGAPHHSPETHAVRPETHAVRGQSATSAGRSSECAP